MRTIYKNDIQLIDILLANDEDGSPALLADKISKLFKRKQRTILLDLDNEEYFLFSIHPDKEMAMLVGHLHKPVFIP